MKPMTLVRRAHDRGITTLTLDSPANRNALSAQLVAELADGLEQAAKDPEARAVVLTHTGGTFCAGADLKDSTSPSEPRRLAELLYAIVELPKHVLAHTTGHVRAGGLGLLAACDLAVAGPAVTFAFTEAQLGLAPAVISLPILPRLDPRATARYYLTAILDGLRAGSPQGLAESKRLTTAAALRTFVRDTDAAVEQSARLFASPEAAEGIRALLERRSPPWAL